MTAPSPADTPPPAASPGGPLSPAYCAERAAALLGAADRVAHGVVSDVDGQRVWALLAVAERWEALGVAMAKNMAMAPPRRDDDE